MNSFPVSDRYTRLSFTQNLIPIKASQIESLTKYKNWPSAVIAGAFQTGVLGVRNLQRHGVNAICFDCNPVMQGFRSVYGPARLCPDPDKDPKAWIQFMLDLAGELGEKAVLIPSSDRYVTAIADHREELLEYFTLCPGIEMQGLLAEKQTQYRLAFEHGMPMSGTHMVSSKEDLLEFAETATYPCLLKPWHFREWEKLAAGHPLLNAKIAIGHSKKELLESYELVRDLTPNLIAQEIIEGPDTNKRVYLACYNSKGARIANAMFRELRCVPIGFGPASASEPVTDVEADEICDRFLRNIGYVGICEIEVKRDARDDKVKLIEANPRLSGGGDAAPYAGVDLVWIHYQDMIGIDVEYVAPSDRKFKHIVLRAEGTAIPAYMQAGLLSWRGLLSSYKLPVAFFDVDFRDLKLTLGTILVFLKLIVVNSFKARPKE